MPIFKIPPDEFPGPAHLRWISLLGSVDLEAAVLKEGAEQLGDDHQTCSMRGETHRLILTLGLHWEDLGDGESPWLHYQLTWRRVKKAAAESDADCDAAVAWLAEVLPKHEMNVQARFDVQEPDTFAFPLPMPLDSMGLSGFSEVRGVRLVEPDPEDPDRELYSVVLDGGAATAAWAVVQATMDARIDDDLFAAAGKRASSILDLAVIPEEAES